MLKGLMAFVLFFCSGVYYVDGATKFTMDGDIISGDTRISMSDRGVIAMAGGKGDKSSIVFSLKLGDRQFSLSDLTGKGLDIKKAKKIALFSGNLKIPDQAKPAGIEYSLALTSDDKARITLKYLPANIFTSIGIQVKYNHAQMAGESVKIDGKSIAIDKKPAGNIFTGKAEKIILFPDEITRKITFITGKAETVSITDSDKETCLDFSTKSNELAFDIDLAAQAVKSASGETYTGVDFWAGDKLKMPRYELSRNLVQNPGFEEGLNFWRFGPLGAMKESRLGDYYKVEETGAFNGRRCLKIIGEKDQTPAHAASFAIPVEAGADYTISFYAKGDRPGLALATQPTSANWGVFPGSRTFPVTTEWKRYSTSFKAPNGIISLDFGINKPSSDCAIWLDAVQLEKGPLTDYTEKPFAVELQSARRDDLFQPGEKVAAALNVYGAPQAKGKLGIRMTDFFDRVVAEDNQNFTIGADGKAVIPVPSAEKLAPGLYIIETNVQTDSGFADRSFHRLAIMNFLDGKKIQHKNIFCDAGDTRRGNWARRAEQYNHFGIGSAIYFNAQTHPYLAILDKAGILYFSSILKGGEDIGKWHLIKDFHRTDEELKTIEEAAYNYAKEYPEIRHWKTINEPGGDYQDNVEEMKVLIKSLAAIQRGIKRANPDALITSPDPANMYPKAGIQYIETFLKAGGASVCDIMAIHPYRPRPEQPDLDADTATFLEMLNKHGYKGDVWFSEGIYHNNYILPAYNLDSHQGCSSDHYRGGDFSYHLGYGEKIAAAYTMRSWLTALKYADRVKLYVDWNFHDSSYLGIDMVPTAKAFVPNILSNLLGNAVYRSDIDLGKNLRGYLFEDEQKRPVAALWTYNIITDTTGQPGPKMNISAIPADVEFIDFMGKTVTRPASNEMNLSSFPVFMRGKPGTLAAMRDALAKIQVESADASPVETYLKVIAPDKVEICISSLLARDLTGRLRIFKGEEKTPVFDRNVTLYGRKTQSFPQAITLDNDFKRIAFKVEFQAAGSDKAITANVDTEILVCHRAVRPVEINGSLSGWPAPVSLPARFMEFAPYLTDTQKMYDLKKQHPNGIAWKSPDDLSAALYTAWDKDYFYFGMKVKDDVFCPAEKLEAAWGGDSIQLYFDSWADARTHDFKGYDNNDQVFDLWPSPKGLVVKRAVAPEQQLAFLKTGVVPEVRSAYKRTGDGYTIYETAFPLRQIAPVNLKAGTIFGFALIVNDHDGDYRKRGLTLTPAGTEPHMRPDLYPVIILTE